MSQIFAFGDSITWGSWDPEGGWADRLKREIIKIIDESEEDYEIIFYNLGIPSQRTDQLLERFKNEVDARFDEDNQEKYFIFSFGANDSAFKNIEKKFHLSVDEYRSNIEKAIKQARDYSNNFVFLNTTPVNEIKTDGTLNESRKNEYIDKYNQVLAEACNKNNIDLLDVNFEFKKHNELTLLYEDGLHPNTEGHKIILNLVKNYLTNKGLF